MSGRDVLVTVTVPRRTPSGRELAPAVGEATVRLPDRASVVAAAEDEIADVTARTSVAVVAPDGLQRLVEVELPLREGDRWLDYGDSFAYRTLPWVIEGEVVEEKQLVLGAGGQVVGARTYRYSEVGA